MALFILVLMATAIGFSVIIMVRGGAEGASSQRARAATLESDDTDLRLKQMDTDRLEEVALRLIERLALEVESVERVGSNSFDIMARETRPLIGGNYLFQGIAAGDHVVDAPIVVALGDALRALQANKAILITTGYFTDEAVQVATDYPIELVGRDQFRALLTENGLLMLLSFDQPPPSVH